MEFPGKYTYTIIGEGAVGGALLHFLQSNQLTIKSSWTSDRGMVFNNAHSENETGVIESSIPQDESHTGSMVFITVPDDAISKVSGLLARTSINWNGKSVVHCSGNLFSDELYELEEKGARTASMHPLQTFKRGDDADRFANIYVTLQGDSVLCEFLSRLVNDMKAISLQVQKEQKQMLHIAAVFVSNYFVTILHEAEKLLKKQELEQGLAILQPLIRQTLDNALTMDAEHALTGPIARGDAESVEKHLSALQNFPDSSDLYKILGKRTLLLAKHGNRLSDRDIHKLEQLLG